MEIPDTKHPVSPRFGEVLPFAMRLAADPTAEDSDNPDNFTVKTIDTLAPRNPDGTPLLAKPEHNVTPLDLHKAQEIVKLREHLWDGHDMEDEPYSPDPTEYDVRDSTRRYDFKGVRLAVVSSEKPHKTRWTEIEIYVTVGGMFIVHRIGVTTLAHLEDCEQLSKFHKRWTPGIGGIASDEWEAELRQPCPTCNPDVQGLLQSDPASLRFERDRHTVTIAETPEEAIQALYTMKQGKRILGPLATSALQIASDRNPVLAAVYYAPPTLKDAQ